MTTPGDSEEAQFLTENFKLRMDIVKQIEIRKSELASILTKKPPATTDDKIQELRQYVLAMKAAAAEQAIAKVEFATQINDIAQRLTMMTTTHIKMFEQALRQAMEPVQEFNERITAIGAILADKSLDNQQKIHDIEDIVLTS